MRHLRCICITPGGVRRAVLVVVLELKKYQTHYKILTTFCEEMPRNEDAALGVGVRKAHAGGAGIPFYTAHDGNKKAMYQCALKCMRPVHDHNVSRYAQLVLVVSQSVLGRCAPVDFSDFNCCA